MLILAGVLASAFSSTALGLLAAGILLVIGGTGLADREVRRVETALLRWPDARRPAPSSSTVSACPSNGCGSSGTAMDVLSNLGLGFSVALAPANLLYCFLGVLLGTIIGVLPGLGPVATISILLPFTFSLAPQAALIMLAGIYYGAQYGGSTTAILVNLPGESSSVVTAIDGNQMARNGQAGLALATAALASFLAGTFATLVIALAAPSLAEVALKFHPADYFSLMVFGLVAAVILAHGSVVKAIGMILVGMLLGTIGIDVNTSVPRYTFGIPQFGDGMDFAVIAMGIFGIGETIINLERTGTARSYMERIKNLWPTAQGAAGDDRAGLARARCWDRRSAFCRAGARSWHRSRPTRWRRRSHRSRSASAKARSRAWRGPKPPTTARRRPPSFRC